LITLDLEPLTRLTKDLRASASGLTAGQARYLVDLYYQIQEYRKRAGNQESSMVEREEPHELVTWVFDNMETLENDIRRALDRYSGSAITGEWARSIVGIGPVLAAGLMAHINITKCPTVGHIWRFAGLDPTAVWKPHTKRPWNARLKVVCWKIGESFGKCCNIEGDIYGTLSVERKDKEWNRNRAGDLADQCAAGLARLKEPKKDKDAYYWYTGSVNLDQLKAFEDNPSKAKGLIKQYAGEPGSGVYMLPPGHIQTRSRRWATKLFLAHYHHVAYEVEYGEKPPKPYILTQDGHAHYLAPPNWPME
jgi:hypothetical protein